MESHLWRRIKNKFIPIFALSLNKMRPIFTDFTELVCQISVKGWKVSWGD